MRTLVYNWRDLEHPDAGGAEVFTHEVLKRLVDRGHETTLFTSEFEGCEHEEVIDGVRIVRSGGRFTVYRRAKKYYRNRFRREFDVVVDEINTRPFMTPSFVEEPVVALIHQLAREFWFYETPFPVSWLGYYWLEDRWLARYTDVPTVTVSESTKEDLLELGFQDVTVVPQGVDVEPVGDVPEKADNPTFLFVGRMQEAKRPDHAIDAFEHIVRHRPEAELHVVGEGYLLDDLKERTDGSVTFHGHVSEAKKRELMKRSHVLLVPGVREGWGLVVTEANALGTPAVGYDVPGLRDSIREGENGLLAAQQPSQLAQRALTVLDTEYERYADAAIEISRGHDWDDTADVLEGALLEARE